jgi:hypothetical protein
VVVVPLAVEWAVNREPREVRRDLRAVVDRPMMLLTMQVVEVAEQVVEVAALPAMVAV